MMSAVLESFILNPRKVLSDTLSQGRGVSSTLIFAKENSPVIDAPASPKLKRRYRWYPNRLQWLQILPPFFGVLLLVLIWEIFALKQSVFPSPLSTSQEAIRLFSDPFYHKNLNDQGIGWNLLVSLQKVAAGFGLAAIVGIPLGFMVGRFRLLAGMLKLISLCKPISPLVWLPLGMLIFHGPNTAAVWATGICSVWPIMFNTVIGVQRVPQDYLNIARVLNMSEWKIVTKIFFPSMFSYILTGVRMGLGSAWIVVVAAEISTGIHGIGPWMWEEWKRANVPHVVIAIIVIGIVGYLLEQIMVTCIKACTYGDTPQ